MNNKVLRVDSFIELYSTEEGGRASFVSRRYMPNIEINKKWAFAAFMLPEDIHIDPGCSAEVELAVIASPSILESIKVKDQFSIVEGNKKVGRGMIERIVEMQDRAW